MEEDVIYVWTEDCEQAFQELKHQLITAPIITNPLEQQPFILDTDASTSGIGAVLSQVQNDEEKPTAYASITEKKLITV